MPATSPVPASRFTTTRWSVVLSAAASGAPHGRDALARLCEIYRPPILAYIKRCGASAEDAEDLTQEFFTTLLQKNVVRTADPVRGRFRSFLLASVKHFLANEWDRRRALKRGGGALMVPLDDLFQGGPRHEPATMTTPEWVFEYHWAQALLQRTHEDLRGEQERAGKTEVFMHLRPYLLGDSAASDYPAAVAALQSTPGAVRVALHRLRRRFRAILLERVAETVEEPSEIDAELQYLMKAVRAPDDRGRSAHA